ncbi:MAG TPA: cation:proton antiporter [Prolixibacteraceae bacterium]|nr:cation:proton antiporter [Bacteroidales bacterium]HNQ36819.1 cation:proton antiporter [Prolixibacteraceae bacterium]HPJ78824.1 cation:proton antiporter [Prolixibacteraceae bacterium]
MDLLTVFNITLPLTNPVLIFSVILFVILFTPILLDRLSIPHLIGLIIAGILIGPYGFNLITRDSSIVLFGTVGLLYIMFISSLEMDMDEFRKNTGKSSLFGFYTFLVPMVLGTLTSFYLLKFSWITSVLLASMYASNTLITYPIVSKLGIAKTRAVNISIGATIITTVAALLVLAIIVGMTRGEITPAFWIRMAISFLLFGVVIIFVFPRIGRWFFKRYHESVGQYIFVLGMVFLGSFLSQLAGIEPIVGAFLVGMSLNKLIPATSPLMNRIEFVGNALFIPIFLIGVGMLIDLRSFLTDRNTIVVALVMTVVATAAKWIAAWMAQKTFKYSATERGLMFGLTNSQAASTLAAVLVGYNVILGTAADGTPIRLLNDAVLNGTVIMILITCTIASFVTQKSAQQTVLGEITTDEMPGEADMEEKVLIPLGNIDNVEELVNLSVTVKSNARSGVLIGLNIINNMQQNLAAEKNALRLMEKAQKVASATENTLLPLVRYDINLVNGISSVVKENKVTDLIIGLHEKRGITDTFLGDLTNGILNTCNTTTLIYRAVQPLSTIRRTIVYVPDNAEKEIGFPYWLVKIWNIGRNTGSDLIFYGAAEIMQLLQRIHFKHPVTAEFRTYNDWDNFLALSKEVRRNDNLVFVLSRKDYPSYHPLMAQIPLFINTYFSTQSFTLVFPMQSGVAEEVQFNATSPSMYEPLSGAFDKGDDLLRIVSRLFRKK